MPNSSNTPGSSNPPDRTPASPSAFDSRPSDLKPRPAGFARPTRDAVTTIRDDGSRRYLHPADTRGRFATARLASGWLLIGIYLSLPWIEIGGHPAVFLDVGARRFHLFGLTLAFQDIWLLFFAITGLGFGLFFITALLGRVWCGWACPQTVFLDHIYRRIERLLEGDAPARRALDAAPWSATKTFRRGGKHVLYVLASATIAHLFIAYFVSIPELWSMMRAAPGEHWTAFLFVALFSGILYFNFAWFREQLCVIICPYGRLQSALIDDHSLVIGYDEKRGEPRGKLGIPDAGACIACDRCVRVCPTGIDIRQGLQLECIGCAACIDACDDVMTKIHRPTGLIRYDSLAGLRGEKTRWFRPRTFLYAALLLVGAIVATLSLSTVRPANFQITRLGGTPYFVEESSIRNQFLVRLVNKRDHAQRFTLTLSDPSIVVSGWSDTIELAPLAEDVRPLILQIPLTSYTGPVAVQVNIAGASGAFQLARTVEFVGPDPALLKKKESAP
jgi:cytochrome c oxidase accessory protein FixG